MKTKKKRIVIKASPRIRDLAERLFDVGIAGWNAVDNKKTIMKFNEIDHPGQIAGWYAIARHVEETMKALEKSMTP